MTGPQSGAEWGSREYRRRERRTVLIVLLAGLPLFLAVFAVVPSRFSPVFANYHTLSTSMEPALPMGTHFIVSRLSYGYSRHSFDWFSLPLSGRRPDGRPQRGDIAAFRLPRDQRTTYVKRVIGLPGDVIQMREGRLWLNGTIVHREPAGTISAPEPEAKRRQVPAYVERLPEGVSYRIIETDGDRGVFDNTPPVTIPAGHYFLMGDNRDNSADSRAQWAVGLVPLELFIGRLEGVLPIPARRQ